MSEIELDQLFITFAEDLADEISKRVRIIPREAEKAAYDVVINKPGHTFSIETNKALASIVYQKVFAQYTHQCLEEILQDKAFSHLKALIDMFESSALHLMKPGNSRETARQYVKDLREWITKHAK